MLYVYKEAGNFAQDMIAWKDYHPELETQKKEMYSSSHIERLVFRFKNYW